MIDVEAYRRDGFLVVPRLYDADTMLQWKRIIGEIYKPIDSGVEVWMCDQLPSALRSAMTDGLIAPGLRELIGDEVAFLSAKVVLKDCRVDYPSPWHQDRHYWLGSEKTSVWIALDDATIENGCLKMIPGSHRMDFTNQRIEGGVTFANRTPEDQVAGLPVVDLPLQRGGVVFFSDMTMHSSHGNATGKDRWSLISTYRDATVADESTVWETSMPLANAR